MSTALSAVVLGASGSVGNAIIRELLRSGAFGRIVTLTRASQPDQLAAAQAAQVELREVIVPTMTADRLQSATVEAVRAIEVTGDGDVVGLSVLGVGAATAKLTIDQHRAVDVQLNVAFALGLAASGRVRHLALMSAVGADASASTEGSGAAGSARYNRVKGEAEAGVMAAGLPIVSIFRPSLIIGSQHTPWLLEKVMLMFTFVTPAKFRSISVAQIAKAMVATSRRTPTASAIYHYTEMMALNRNVSGSVA